MSFKTFVAGAGMAACLALARRLPKQRPGLEPAAGSLERPVRRRPAFDQAKSST